MAESPTLGLFLAKRRIARGVSQGALAKAVGVTRPHITQIENGRRKPSDELFMSLLSALEISVEDFLRECGPGQIPDEQLQTYLRLTHIYDLLTTRFTPQEIADMEAFLSSPDDMAVVFNAMSVDPALAGPDGWADLAAEDRRLVQRLINRLQKDNAVDEKDNHGDQA